MQEDSERARPSAQRCGRPKRTRDTGPVIQTPTRAKTGRRDAASPTISFALSLNYRPRFMYNGHRRDTARV